MFKSYFSYNREQYNDILEDPNSILWKHLNRFIVFTIFISIFILVLESIRNLDYIYSKYFFIADFFISSIFLFEYLYRFSRSLNKFNFLFKPLNIIDLLAFLPFFLWFLFASFIPIQVLKVLRLARVFRILKLAKHIPVIVWFVKALNEYKDEYRWIAILFVMILSIFSIFIYQAEHVENYKMFSSIPQAIWWWIVTMATVWYWDVYPITPFWKIIWSVLIILWPVLLAVLSSITILVFMDVAETQREKLNRGWVKVCHRCKNRNPRQANYCMKCWENVE